MKNLILSTAMALLLPGLAVAQQMVTPQEKGLSSPVVALMPVVVKNVDALNLDDAQKAAIDEWMKVAPAARGALEDETAGLREKMAELILTNAPQADREALAAEIGAKETALILMRSACADNLRTVLTPEQFAKVLELAAAK